MGHPLLAGLLVLVLAGPGCIGTNMPPIQAPDEHLVSVDVDVGFGSQKTDQGESSPSFSTDLRLGWHGMTPFFIVGAQIKGRYWGRFEAPSASPEHWALGGDLELIHILTGLNLRAGPLVGLDGSVGFSTALAASIFGVEVTAMAGRRFRYETLFVLRLPISLVTYGILESRHFARR